MTSNFIKATLLALSVAVLFLGSSTTAMAQKNKVILRDADKPKTPLYSASYDRRNGRLNLIFHYQKVLFDAKHSRARHIDSLTLGGKVYKVELHADSGPRVNGRYIYNRNTVKNNFSIFVGKWRNLSKGLVFRLNDHPGGGGLIYWVRLR